MEKFWTVLGNSTKYKSLDEASIAAKKLIARNNSSGYSTDNVTIMESVAFVKAPIPEYEVVKITA